jgi:hypothetical protein
LIPSLLTVRIRELVLPALVLFVLDLLAAAIFFGPAQGFWLFKNTTNWIQVAADLTFAEGVLCLLMAGLSGSGIGEHRTLVSQSSSGASVDMKEYAVGREKSISFAFQLVGIGVILILLTLLLYLVST